MYLQTFWSLFVLLNFFQFDVYHTSTSIPDHLLLMTYLDSNGKAIARMDLEVYSIDDIPVQDVGTPLAVDVDPRQRRIYWTDNSTASIKSAFLNGSDSRVEYTSPPGLGPERRGLAVDHLSRLIFYTDFNNAVIGMLSIGRCLAKLIVSTDLRRPHGIALDMMNGVMFWTDVGDSPRIERANYDGSERTAIVNTSLRLPYALTLDLSQNILYWADADVDRIERVDLVGKNRAVVQTLSDSHFYGLTFNRGFLYVTDHSPYLSNSTGVLSFIHQVNVASDTFTKSWTSSRLMSYAECYDQENVIAGPNGCNSSTDCSDICIPTPNNGRACLQPDSTTCSVSLPGCGGTFTSPSGTITSPRYPRNYTGSLDCTYYIVQQATHRITLTLQQLGLRETPQCADDYLEILDGNMSTSPIIDVRLCGNIEVPLDLRSTKNAIRIRFKTNSVNSSTGFNISYTAGIIPKSFLLIVDSGAAMFRLDPDVFSYTRLPIQNLQSPVAIDYDPEEDRVYWTDVRAKEIRSAFLNGTNNQLIFSLHPGASCEGLAIDYLSRLVFYTDSGNDVIGSVSISNLKQQTVIISDLDQPGAIALHLTKRFIFWASSGTSPKLERANYDGSERRVLLTLSSQSRLAGLALDLKNDWLYWADAAQERIERIDLQGGNRKAIFHLPQSRFFALALSGDYIFVTNLNSSLSTVLRVRIDASESTYKRWSTTSTLKGLCLYNERTRLRAENPTNITSSKTGLIAGVTGGCLAGLVIVISVVIFVVKRRAGKRTPPAVRELPRAPVEWKSRSSTSSQVPLDKAVDYGKGDGDYGDYCELDDVQRQFSSVQRYVSLNQYITPRPDYEQPVPPPPPSSSDPRSSRQGSTNVKI